ncbi:MAG: radical SAM protein [Anaerolineaceae bacterium]|nr:radical SAM protein [Anaerolineaceae bacterium]MBN2677209.1 radical SAM protein [Anaerolineaceae bacterium]
MHLPAGLIKSKDKTPYVGDRPLAGIYHFTRERPGTRSRVHLRIDPDGHGTLIVNAARFYHLNLTATHMAYQYLNGIAGEKLASLLQKTYRIDKKTALQDALNLTSQIDDLIFPDGICPICDLQLEVTAPFSAMPVAPYRMDLALTYRCNNDCAHCYNARGRNHPELDTQSWKQILDLLWSLGIPHVVFTGGEPTLRDDLPDLIAYAEHNGQITGINTNGRRLADNNYLTRLVDAGLDHAQITVESHNPEIHDHMVKSNGAWKQTIQGLENALASKLYVMTNTTLLKDNSPLLSDTLSFLHKSGVPTVGLNALIYSGKGKNNDCAIPESDLPPLLSIARQLTDEFDQRLIWYTPTMYCHFDPALLELGVKGCSAARYNMCIESDGTVLPCQSYYSSLGNILRDQWDTIWNHDLALSLREHRDAPAVCKTCSVFAECGGGCPLARQAGMLKPSQYQPVK